MIPLQCLPCPSCEVVPKVVPLSGREDRHTRRIACECSWGDLTKATGRTRADAVRAWNRAVEAETNP